jgi:hypothetical protein
MNIFVAPRGKGKTTKLIEESLRTGTPILCFDAKETLRVSQLLKKEVHRIQIGESKIDSYIHVEPINFHYLYRYTGGNVLVDNLDIILQQLLPKLNIRTATISSE